MKAFVAKISESGKSACVMLRTSKFSMELTPVYIPNDNYKVKQEVEIPDDLKVINWGDRTTKEGIPLKTLVLASSGVESAPTVKQYVAQKEVVV